MSGSPEDMEIVCLSVEVEHLRQRADRAERILAALREPNEITTDAFFEEYWNTAHPANALRAAVTAAEQEVDHA